MNYCKQLNNIPLRAIDILFKDYIKDYYDTNDILLFTAALTSFVVSTGNVCLDMSSPVLTDDSNAIDIVFPEIKLWEATLLKSSAVTTKERYKEFESPLVIYNKKVFLRKYFVYENIIAREIASRIKQNRTNFKEINISKFIEFVSKTVKTNYLQIAAALTAYQNNSTIITGGPGTGKTTTLIKLIYLLTLGNNKLKVDLVAPTGKAAQRMKESLSNSCNYLTDYKELGKFITSIEPQTIHRLLKPIFGTSDFHHKKDNPINSDIVIIDEASMIDLPLFAKLILALKSNCKLILIGDPYQLSSVEAGNVLGEICRIFKQNSFPKELIPLLENFTPDKLIPSDNNFPLIHLEKSYRFKDKEFISIFSSAVKTGSFHTVKELIDTGIINLKQEITIEELAYHYKELITAQTVSEALILLSKCIILTPYNKGKESQEFYNNAILDYFLKLSNSTDEYVENMPIMVTDNNYSLSLFNGDTGIIRKDNDKWMACFNINGSLVNYPLPLIGNWQSAFAITVHKSQGSEYSKVILALGSKISPLLSRELIYTAITRVKPPKNTDERKSLLLIAEPEPLEYAINNPAVRNSGLSELLMEELEPYSFN